MLVFVGSFSEIQDSKQVLIVHFEGKKLAKIQEVKVPRFRELVSFSGDLASIKGKLERFDAKRKGKLEPWVDISIEMDENIPNLDGEIREFAKDFWMDILKIRKRHSKFGSKMRCWQMWFGLSENFNLM